MSNRVRVVIAWPTTVHTTHMRLLGVRECEGVHMRIATGQFPFESELSNPYSSLEFLF